LTMTTARAAESAPRYALLSASKWSKSDIIVAAERSSAGSVGACPRNDFVCVGLYARNVLFVAAERQLCLNVEDNNER
jgi:hypothetical protein